jgi:hypothetical protein
MSVEKPYDQLSVEGVLTAATVFFDHESAEGRVVASIFA